MFENGLRLTEMETGDLGAGKGGEKNIRTWKNVKRREKEPPINPLFQAIYKRARPLLAILPSNEKVFGKSFIRFA